MTFGGILSYVAFQLFVPLLFTIGMASFLWGTFLYFIAGSRDEELAEKGKAVMLYGLLVFIASLLAWGLLRVMAAVAAGTMG